MIVAIIGIGLIGGSMAIGLKESGFAQRIIGVDQVQENLDKAIRRRLIDEDMELSAAVKIADLIIVATPVSALNDLLPQILDQVDQQVVIDVGSTKTELMANLKHHPNRKNYVGTHPMAGTEYSGPEAAIPNLFDNCVSVICDPQDSAPSAVQLVQEMYQALKMQITEMNSREHDVHCAYVSHISHISSFALALTVLEKETDERNIFELASGGFSSTVRLAKSSPQMWVPIFQQNRDNVLDVLDEHINTLAQFRSLLIKKDYKKFHSLIDKANSIRRILDNK